MTASTTAPTPPILLQHSDLFIDTIEVDRGPQNSLHGANADGGTINYISKRPTKDFYAEGRVGVANNQRYWGEAVVSGPITDWLRFRLGGNYTSEHGGFFKNLGAGKDAGRRPAAGDRGREPVHRGPARREHRQARRVGESVQRHLHRPTITR